MDQEGHSDIKWILAKFQNHSRSTTLPANYFRNAQQVAAPTISSVRSNPAFLGIISALEHKPQPILPPTFKKPELPAKPSGDSEAVKQLFSPKDYSENHSVVLLKRNSNDNRTVLQKEFSTFKLPLPPQDKVSSAADPMKLSKGLKKTLHINIGDSSRSDGDGVCTRSPQVYRQSYPTFVEANPFQAVDQKQSEGQDCYETVSDGPQTSEKPSVPYAANPKPQMSSLSKRPPSFSMSNNSEVQDCYEIVNDAPLPFIPPRKSQVQSFPPKTFFKEVEANHSKGSGYYVAVSDRLQTQKKHLAHGKYQTFSFSRKNPPSVPETHYAKDQDYYETVNEAPQNLEKISRPFIPPKKSPVPPYSQVLEPNKLEGQHGYEDVLHAKEKPPISFSASKKFQDPLFAPQKNPTAVEPNQSSSQYCYEAPEDIPQTRAEPSPTFDALSKFQALSVSGPLLPAEPEANGSDDQDCYEDVDSTFPSQVETPLTFRDYPSFETSPFAERSQCDGQESYEDVESTMEAEVERLPPVVDPTSSQHNSGFKVNHKSFRAVEVDSLPDHSHVEDLSPKPTGLIIKPKRNVLPWKSPRIKLLPSIKLLGPPPPKDSRPPHVDLMPYLPFPPQVTEVKDNQKEMPETGNDTEYELPPPSPAYDEESLYADARQLNWQEDGESNEYKVEESESLEANQLREIFPSADERREHAEDGLQHERSTGDLTDYEAQEVGLALGSERASECVYEVCEAGGDAGVKRGAPSVYSMHYSLSPSIGDLQTQSKKEDNGKNTKLTKPEPTSGKRSKISGPDATLYSTTIVKDIKPEKHTLPLKRGDVIDVIRITDCPPGKWLVKDHQDNYGFVPVSCVDMNKSILTFSSRPLSLGTGAPRSYEPEWRNYNSAPATDLHPTCDSHSVQSDDTYDDVGNRSPAPSSPGGRGKGFGNFFKKDFRLASSVTSSAAGHNSGERYSKSASESGAKEKESMSWRLRFLKNKQQKLKAENPRNYGKGISQVSSKKLAKEEKIFREKFKYAGDINVFSVATVTDLAPTTIKSKLDLFVKPGDAVEVIDVTSEDQLICRNSEGKFGYVRIEHLNFHNSS